MSEELSRRDGPPLISAHLRSSSLISAHLPSPPLISPHLPRRDDLWSLLYMLLELLGGELPWHVTKDRDAVLAMKRAHEARPLAAPRHTSPHLATSRHISPHGSR